MRSRPPRSFRQVVDRWTVSQQEESVERAVLARRFSAVKISLAHPALMQFFDAPARFLAQLANRAELNRIGRARLSAGGLDAVLLPVVTEGAFVGVAVGFVARDDAERAGRDA